jgi:hypothetical protein
VTTQSREQEIAERDTTEHGFPVQKNDPVVSSKLLPRGDLLGRRLLTLAGVTTVIIATGLILTTLLMTVRAYLPMPLGDQWDEVTSAEHLSRLFSPHNEHVLFFPRLLFIVDKSYFGGSNIFNEAMTFFIQFVHSALLWIVARRAKLPALLSAGIILSTLFWSYQYENFILGFQVQFVGVCAAATAALVILAFKRERGVWWAIGLGLIATLSMSNGLLVALLLVSLAICLRLPWRYIGVLLVGAAAMVTIYLGLHRSAASLKGTAPVTFGTLLGAIAYPRTVMSYAGVYLGAPFGRLLFRGHISGEMAIHAAATIGICGLGILLVAASMVWRRIRSGQTQDTSALVLIHIALFGVASALVTAIGRSRAFPIYQAFSGRYGAVALVFWLCLTLLIWHLALPGKSWVAALPASAGVFACLVMAASQPFIMGMVLTNAPNRPSGAPIPEHSEQHALAWRLADRQAALTAILSGVYDQAALESIYPRPEELPQRVSKLRAVRMAPFNEAWSQWLGSTLPNEVSISHQACIGGFSSVSALGPGTWRVSGWDQGVGGRTADRIVLLSNAGIVVGYGLRSPGNTLEEALVGSNPQWHGHASGSEGTLITAYTLDAAGKSACFVGSAKLESPAVL